MLKPCIVCSQLTRDSRCPAHAIQRPRGRQLHALRQAHVLGALCAYCGRPAEHLDHIVPVSQGGSNAPSNLQPLCAQCNLAKGDR